MKDALERCNNSIGEDSVGVRLVEKGKKECSGGRVTMMVAQKAAFCFFLKSNGCFIF